MGFDEDAVARLRRYDLESRLALAGSIVASVVVVLLCLADFKKYGGAFLALGFSVPSIVFSVSAMMRSRRWKALLSESAWDRRRFSWEPHKNRLKSTIVIDQPYRDYRRFVLKGGMGWTPKRVGLLDGGELDIAGDPETEAVVRVVGKTGMMSVKVRGEAAV